MHGALGEGSWKLQRRREKEEGEQPGGGTEAHMPCCERGRECQPQAVARVTWKCHYLGAINSKL